jgi:hypothetical protein
MHGNNYSGWSDIDMRSFKLLHINNYKHKDEIMLHKNAECYLPPTPSSSTQHDMPPKTHTQCHHSNAMQCKLCNSAMPTCHLPKGKNDVKITPRTIQE